MPISYGIPRIDDWKSLNRLVINELRECNDISKLLSDDEIEKRLSDYLRLNDKDIYNDERMKRKHILFGEAIKFKVECMMKLRH